MKAKLLIIFLMGLGALLKMANAAVGVDVNQLPIDLLSEIKKVCRASYGDGDSPDWSKVIPSAGTDKNGSYVDTVCDEGKKSEVKIKSRLYYITTTENYKSGLRNILGNLVPQGATTVSSPILDFVTVTDPSELNGFLPNMTKSNGWVISWAARTFTSNATTLTTNSQDSNAKDQFVSQYYRPELYQITDLDFWVAGTNDFIQSEYLRPSYPDSKVSKTFIVRNACKGVCQNSMKKLVYVSITGQKLSYVFGLTFNNSIEGNKGEIQGHKQVVYLTCPSKSQCTVEKTKVIWNNLSIEGTKLTWSNGSSVTFIDLVTEIYIQLVEG